MQDWSRVIMVAAFLATPTGTCLFAASPDAGLTLSRYENVFSPLLSASFDAVDEISKRTKGSAESRLVQRSRCEVLRNQNDWCMRQSDTYYAERNNIVHEETSKYEYLIKDNRSLIISWSDGSNKIESVVAHRDLPQEQRERLGAQGCFMFVYGYLQGANDAPYLPKLLRACDKLEAEDTILDQRNVVKLTGIGRYGTYELWLDPQVDYHPRRIEYLKTGSDVAGEKPLNEYEQRLDSIKLVGDEFEFAEVDGAMVLTGFQLTWTNKYEEVSKPGFA